MAGEITPELWWFFAKVFAGMVVSGAGLLWVGLFYLLKKNEKLGEDVDKKLTSRVKELHNKIDDKVQHYSDKMDGDVDDLYKQLRKVEKTARKATDRQSDRMDRHLELHGKGKAKK